MDALPTELHAYICQTACIDDGTTIRALSGVSRYYREVSRPFLYQNVSAFGVNQVMDLLEQLERLPAQMRLIRYLFLSDVSSEGPKSSPESSHAPQPSRLTDEQTQALARIISLSAPTLKSFSLVAHSPFSSTSLIARVFRTSFPHLQSLSISGFYPFPSSVGKFPSLKHLHLSGNRNPHGLLHMCALEETFPALATLTITGLGAAGGFVIELEEALAVCEVPDDSAMPSSLPQTLRKITLQAAPEPVAVPVDAAYPDTVMMKDRILVSRLDALKVRKVKDASGVEVEVLERSLVGFSPDDIRRRWMDRICG